MAWKVVWGRVLAARTRVCLAATSPTLHDRNAALRRACGGDWALGLRRTLLQSAGLATRTGSSRSRLRVRAWLLGTDPAGWPGVDGREAWG